tara:strand:- start:762 stop:1001 length:240 start_codon:yes stop_codon:yes gene_type:complete
MEFKKDNITIILTKEESESINNFIERGYFIIYQDNIDTNLDYYILLSKIWINIKYKKCIYNQNIMNLINKMEKKYKLSI